MNTYRIINYILTSLFLLLLATGSTYAATTQPKGKASNDMNTAQDINATHELTSSLIVNGRVLGPQKILTGNKKTHITIFRESGSRQYQVTYRITADPNKDSLIVSTSVSAVVFSPSFQLMSGQRASAKQIPELPEMEIVVSTRKLPAQPHTNQTDKTKKAH